MPFCLRRRLQQSVLFDGEERQVFHRRIWRRSPYSINLGIS